MAVNRHHPETLHFLARLLVGTREADQSRVLGGMFYSDLIQRVQDVRAAGLANTKQEASDDRHAATPHPVSADPQGPRRS